MENQGEIIIYQTEDGLTHIEVKIEDETVWLSQQQMADLYQTSRTNVVEHIKHIYEEGELDEQSTCRNFRQVRQEGSREVTRNIPFYNLDMIISLGYRVKSSIATRFRRWATARLKEYMIKGFTTYHFHRVISGTVYPTASDNPFSFASRSAFSRSYLRRI